MNSKTKGIFQILLILLVTAAMGVVAYTGIGAGKRGSAQNIRLGLDLAGGVSVTYEATKENPTAQEMSDTVYKMQKRVENESTEASVYQEGSNRVTVDVPDVEDPQAVLDKLGKAGALEFGYYTEPLGEIQWEIGDSTKNVLGYECVMATANYHGRDWSVWFSPEIPMQEGPWKLTGLPGLILEATESTGQHGFVATGLESSNQIIYPIYPYPQYDKMSRKDILRQMRNYRDNGTHMNAAATGMSFGKDHVKNEEEVRIDFLETDYR